MTLPRDKNDLPIRAFVSSAAWEGWLQEQPRTSKGVWLKLAKAASGITSVSKREAIDGALCHGWIDGQADRFDADYWLIRFTPRKARSKWSEKNRVRAQQLIAEGRVSPHGLAEVRAAQADGRWDAAYAPASTAMVPDDLQAALDANPQAAAFFATLTGANRYAILYRIGAVKKAETRARKIADYVAMLERGETLH